MHQEGIAAIKWAQEILKKDFLILDTETTGFGFGSEAIEIAVIDKNRNILINQRIKPIKAIPKIATRVHGISNEDVQFCPTFCDIYHDLKSILVNKLVLIYNVSFDTFILKEQCALNALPSIHFTGECVMRPYSACKAVIAGSAVSRRSTDDFCGEWNDYYGNYKWQPLQGGNHTALGNCQATLDVVEFLAKGGSSCESRKPN